MTAAADGRTPADLAAELRRLLAIHEQATDATDESIRGFELAVQHAERIAEGGD